MSISKKTTAAKKKSTSKQKNKAKAPACPACPVTQNKFVDLMLAVWNRISDKSQLDLTIAFLKKKEIHIGGIVSWMHYAEVRCDVGMLQAIAIWGHYIDFLDEASANELGIYLDKELRKSGNQITVECLKELNLPLNEVLEFLRTVNVLDDVDMVLNVVGCEDEWDFADEKPEAAEEAMLGNEDVQPVPTPSKSRSRSESKRTG